MLNTRYLCEICRKILDPVDMAKQCDCSRSGVIQECQCPTCWEWRDHTEYEDCLSCCEGCREKAKTFLRLGIIAPDETIVDTFCETVRMRNCITRHHIPITNIELYKGELIAQIKDRARTPVLWEEADKVWQVIDDVHPYAMKGYPSEPE